MRNRWQFILIFIISVILSSVSVATAVEIRFEGYVDRVDDVGPQNATTRFPVGSKLWGSFEILPNLHDYSGTDEDRGWYMVNYSAFFEDFEVTEGMSGFSGGGELIIDNDLVDVQTNSLYDVLHLQDFGTSPLPIESGAHSLTANLFHLFLYDYDGNVFSDDSLPFGIFDGGVSDFELPIWWIEFYSGDKLSGHITSISEVGVPVPEPATVILLGSGLLGLVGFRRKIKK